MWGAGPPSDDHFVGAERVVIHLEVSIVGDSLTGLARDDRGTTREFDGRLSLLAAIDTLVAGSTPISGISTGDQ
jgi:hypothetical protein